MTDFHEWHDGEWHEPVHDGYKMASDLMGLFSALKRQVQERPFYTPPNKRTRPAAKDLFKSAKRHRQLGLHSPMAEERASRNITLEH